MPPKKSAQTEKPANKSKSKKKSLTNTEYDAIFNAVINRPESVQQQILHFKSPIVGKSPETAAYSPKECASLENSQKSLSQQTREKEQVEQMKILQSKMMKLKNAELVVSMNKPKAGYSEGSNNQSESVSTLYSEEFRKNAAFSTPVDQKTSSIDQKQNSFREALKTLKNSETQNETLFKGASTSFANSMLVDVPLSQPPESLNHRERLMWLQARRGELVFVQCDSCDKWRLSDFQDPVDLPDKWYCPMNTDLNYNDCSVPELKLSMYIEADLIVNQYTAGTLVWAKIVSFPWWPAMVDDDPDTEQFYWIEDYELNVPTHYNVTFFDRPNEKVTRAWVHKKNLKSFKHNLDFNKTNVPNKYKLRVKCAKDIALEAMKLSIKERLNKHSFLSNTSRRINTPVRTPTETDDENTSRMSKTKIKKRRYTVDNPMAQLKKSFKESFKKDDSSEVTKKVTKRRKTIADTKEISNFNETIKTNTTALDNPEKKIQRRRKSVAGRSFQRDSSQDSIEPNNVTKQSNTRVDSTNDKSVKITKRRSTIAAHDLKEPQKVVTEQKDKKITKRRTTIAAHDLKESQKVVTDSKNQKEKKITKRRNTSVEQNAQRDSSQDLGEPKKITKRRNTHAIVNIEHVLNKTFSEEDFTDMETVKKEKRVPKRRNTIVESAASPKEPKKITTRRKTRADTSFERSISLDSNREKKITKSSSGKENPDSETSNSFTRRRSIYLDSSIERDSSQDSDRVKKTPAQKPAIDQDSIKMGNGQKEKNTPKLRDSILERDSMQDLGVPKKITRRRNTRVDTSIERDYSKLENGVKEKKTPQRGNGNHARDSSQDSEGPGSITSRKNTRLDTSIERDSSFSSLNSKKEKKIPKRRRTVSVFDELKNLEKEEKLKKLDEPKKITRRRATRGDISIERDSSYSQDSNTAKSDKDNKTQKLGKDNSNLPEKNNNLNTSKASIVSNDSKKSGRISRRRLTEYSESSVERSKNNSFVERDSSQNSAKISSRRKTDGEYRSPTNNKANTIKRRRNTIRECNSQKSSSDELPKDTKRRERDSSQNSESSQKGTKLKTNIDKENTSSPSSEKGKKVTKRRKTICDYNYQTLKAEEAKVIDKQPQENKINRRRNTIEKDISLTDLSGNSTIQKRQSKFVCPTNNSTEEIRLNELKKPKKTLGARKYFPPNIKPKTLNSEHETAINIKEKEEENKRNLSDILEESNSQLNISKNATEEKIAKKNISKKRRQTTDDQDKTITDNELEDTFVSLSHSLEQLNEEKRKKKFMAICQEIVNVDKDPADPTMSKEEKLFYEKLNSSLKEMKEKQNNVNNDDSFKKKVIAFENKLDNIINETDNNNVKSSSNTSTVTSANTSMHSDFYDIDIKKPKNRKSSKDRNLKKKMGSNSSRDSVDSLPFEK